MWGRETLWFDADVRLIAVVSRTPNSIPGAVREATNIAARLVARLR